MRTATHRLASPALPCWWRYTLVAIATLGSLFVPGVAAGCEPADPTGNQRVTRTSPIVRRQPRPRMVRRRSCCVLQGPTKYGPLVRSKSLRRGLSLVKKWPRVGRRRRRAIVPAAAVADAAPAGRAVLATACPEGTLVGPPDEYLCDGGDFGLPAAVRADWAVDGLEPEDAIAHYDTLDGRVIVTPSNRVCVYAPRFAAVRRVENLLAHERRQLIDIAVEDAAPVGSADVQPVVASTQRTGVAINLGERPANLFRGREQATEYVQVVAPGEFFNTVGPYATRRNSADGRNRRHRNPGRQAHRAERNCLDLAIKGRRWCFPTGRPWRWSD